jgi:hypothetical protein
MMDQPNAVLIQGPNVAGRFFLYDRSNRVWDGACWRGFGEPEWFTDYRAAFKARHAARSALDDGWDRNAT